MPGRNEMGISQSQSALDANVDLNFAFNESFKFRFQPMIKYDGSNLSKEEKFLYENLEAHFSFRKSAHQFKLGMSTVNWEGPDFLNPMDLLNAKNYRDPLNMYNRSSAMAAASLQGEKMGIDLVYIPWRSEDIIPESKSPWWPRLATLPTENEDLELRIPFDVQYEIRNHRNLHEALRHNGGIRFQYRGDQWDTSIAAVEATASPLGLHPILSAASSVFNPPVQIISLNNPIIIQPYYYKQRTLAFAFSKAWETVIIRGAIRHSQPLGDNQILRVLTQTGMTDINLQVPSWSQYGVFEIEKHFNVFGEDLTVILEYAESKKPKSSSVSSFTSVLQNVYLIGFRLPLRETWTLNAAFFQDYKSKAHYTHTGLNKSWNDNLSSELAVDLFAGGENTLLGVYDKNDQVSLKTNFAF